MRGERDQTERTDLIGVELDLSPERLMCAGLIGNEQNESDEKPPEADLHAIDAGSGVVHGQAIAWITRRNQDVRI